MSDEGWQRDLIYNSAGNLELWECNAVTIIANDDRFRAHCNVLNDEFVWFMVQCGLQRHYGLNFNRSDLRLCIDCASFQRLAREDAELERIRMAMETTSSELAHEADG